MKFDSITKHSDREQIEFEFEGMDIIFDLDIELGLDGSGSLIVDHFDVINAKRWDDETNSEVKIKFNKLQKLKIQSLWEAKFSKDAEENLEEDARNYEPFDEDFY